MVCLVLQGAAGSAAEALTGADLSHVARTVPLQGLSMYPEGPMPVVDHLAYMLHLLNPALLHDTRDPLVGLDELGSRWYLHPRQHALEIMAVILVCVPALLLTYTTMRRQIALAKAGFKYQPSRYQVMWAWGLFITLMLQLPLKMELAGDLMHHPAFLMQPCHVSAILYLIVTVFPCEVTFILLHSLSLLTWGPFLAFVGPNYPATYYECVLFWLQHVFLVTGPLFASDALHAELYTSHSSYFPFFATIAYHWLAILPCATFTGVNIATMHVPPPALVAYKTLYRPVQALVCLILHTLCLLYHIILCRLRQTYELGLCMKPAPA